LPGDRVPAARLFVALDLPAGSREALAAWRDGALALPALRPVAADALHVTLVFLGSTPLDRLPEVIGATSRATEGAAPARLAARELRGVPPRRPRLLALDLEDEGGRLSAVQSRVATSLAGAGLHRPEARRFWPHVTLSRVRAGARLEGPPPPLTGLPDEAAAFPGVEVVVYRSHLGPRGSRYEPLASFSLGGEPAP